MAEKEGWVTYASTDLEGLKAVALARSLKLAITRRQLIVLTSDKLSSEIWSLLQDEFDSVIRINMSGKTENFNFLAQSYCWSLKKLQKFVFLDNNCLILKNADELFKSDGFIFTETEKNELTIPVISSSNIDVTAVKSLKLFHLDKMNAKEVKRTNQLKSDIFESLDILLTKPLTGKDVKIVHLSKSHPLELLFQNTQQINTQTFGNFERAVLDRFASIFPASTLTKANVSDKGLNPTILNLLQKSSDLKNTLNQVDLSQLTELRDSIAIIGMAFRFPGANTIEQFWDLLSKGQEGIIKLPTDRWTKERCFNQNKKLQATQAGFLQCPIDEIDGRFFGINATELEYMDPQQRLMLQIVVEGLENAGIPPNEIQKKLTGVFGGWWRNDYREMLQEAGLNESEFFRAYMGNALGTVTGRISHCLELTGPSVSTESGCSTSIVGVDLACNSLREENCDIALAVGVNLLIHPFTTDTLKGVISPTGRCKTFDINADGFGRAEGCAVLVLKRFSDAVADGDNVWALIRGSAVVQEGPSKSLGTPTVECEALAMSLALKRAGVLGKDVSFVETHGTGTPVGDPLEVAAVAKVYSKGREDVLTIGSVKTNIGHTESVSGIAGIVKTILSLQNEIIPQHLHLETLNPAINLEVIPAQIPLKPVKWEKVQGKPRIAGVSSFGITGTDAHVIVQETPEMPRPVHVSGNHTPSTKILTISAKGPEAFADYIEKYKNYLGDTSDDLKDIEYSGHVGKGHFSSRVAVIGENKQEILQKLKKKEFETKIASNSTEVQKICFLFTGQGSQYAGMAEDLYKSNLVFQTNFDQCEKIVNETHGFSVKEAIWGTNQAQLSRSLFSQTSIFCIEICLFKLWKSWGVTPDVVLGHSLGEFAAAVAAGILNFETALNLVCTRSKLIDSLPQGKMLVIKENISVVQTLMKKYFQVKPNDHLDIAAVNSPEQTVLAGNTDIILNFSEFCKNNGIKTHVLDATHAFHSSHMDPILKEYGSNAGELISKSQKTFNHQVQYISGMEGKLMKPEDVNSDYWVKHTRESVRFLAASKVAFGEECSLFVEIGPQPVLSAMILTNAEVSNLKVGISGVLPSIRKNESNWKTILTSLAKMYVNGVEINWKNYHRYSNCEQKVKLPSYPFQMKSHWMEMKESESTPFHPLLGSSVPNPSSVKIFRSQIDPLKVHYLMDHMIGTRVIFPGAGYIEMTLAAGHAALQGAEGISGGLAYVPPSTPVTIKNFKIVGPLCLNDKIPTEMQVVVNPAAEDSDDGVAVTVYSKMILDKGTYKWVPHSTANFSPFGSKWDGDEELLNDTIEQIKARCSDMISSKQVSYDRLQEYGMMFGPTFQTLQQVWRARTGDEVLFEVKVTDDPSEYICHPVMTDAMFQALMIAINQNTSSLHVPISLSKFVWSGKITTDSCYIYCKTALGDNAQGKESTAVLMNADGKHIAVMVGAELISTTVKMLMSILDAQKISYPDMYENVWREKLGPLERRNVEPIQLEEITEAANSEGHNELNVEDQQYFNESNKMASLYMIKALKELSFESKVKFGETFDAVLVAEDLKVKTGLYRFFSYCVDELAKDGFFESIYAHDHSHSRKYRQTKDFDFDVDLEVQKLRLDIVGKNPVEFDCIQATGENLADILTGRQSGLNILFPEDTRTIGPAEAIYKSSLSVQRVNETGSFVFEKMFEKLKLLQGSQKTVIRILEVGAGTGTFTRQMLPHMLNDGPMHYEYTYTDISSVFFSNGRSVFENTNIKVNYKLLNIEEDPLQQGFAPYNYDIVFAAFVLHVAKDMTNCLTNIRTLLADDGQVIIMESINPHRPTNMLFGALDGYWQFQDIELRPYNCEMSPEKWKLVFDKLGYQNMSHVPVYNSQFAFILVNGPICSTWDSPASQLTTTNKYWVLFSGEDETSNYIANQLYKLGKNVILVKPKGVFSTAITSKHFRLFEISHDQPNDIFRIFKSVSNEKDIEGVVYLWPLTVKSSMNQIATSKEAGTCYAECAAICQPLLNIFKYLSGTHLSQIKLFIYTKECMNTEGTQLQFPTVSPLYAMTKAMKNEQSTFSTRVVDLETGQSNESLKEAFVELFIDDTEIYVAYRNRCRIVPRLISWKATETALQFPAGEYFKLCLAPTKAISDLRFGPTERKEPNDNQVEVCVKAYALNFRDLFAVLKPDPMFDNWNIIGLDYSGVVTSVGDKTSTIKVGDAVFGCNLSGGALPSHTVVDENSVIRLPNDMTFCEAATLPVVALTSYVCLYKLANLKPEDTILIHTASGGVGLCAIQMAQAVGCKIVATAGSPRKQAYLRNLGIQHIFNSRNTDYEKEIRNALGGSGVDVVLNSLTGAGFKEASLAVCNPNARFIEMSTINIWTKEQVKKLRPDVFYEAIDLSKASNEELVNDVKQVEKLVKNYLLKPLPYVRFDASEIRDAMYFMQKAKHIGKIVCVMPQKLQSSHLLDDKNRKCYLFNDRSSYLITGGLGGIGFEVAKWMTFSGARNLILVGRSSPSESIQEEVNKMRARGNNIYVHRCDVGNFDDCRKLIESIKTDGLPPLRGVMHAAGVLSDGTYNFQSWEKYETTFHPKVRGAINLHKLTINEPLEYLVMFSSVVATLGSLGQSNHSSANYFLDSLVHYRNSIGLPGTTVNWGQWAQVGVAANLEVAGLKPFTVLQGISALEKIFRCNKPQASVFYADMKVVRAQLASVRSYLEEVKTSKSLNDNDSAIISKEEFWKKYDGSGSHEEKYLVMKHLLIAVIKGTLKMDSNDTLEENMNFQDLGMDSLMMIEMKNSIQASIGDKVKISVSAVRDCKTLGQLTNRLVELISGEAEVQEPSRQELGKLIVEDSVLSEDIQPDAKTAVGSLSELKTILLTGASGNLGPYVLRQIFRNIPNVEKIYCLMRSGMLVTKERLTHVLKEKNLLGEIDMDKVECVEGDIVKTKLGLDETVYENLASNVHAVFHLAATTNYDDFYAKTEQFTHTRMVNVIGMKNIIKFASDGKTKHFFHASSMTSTTRLNNKGTLSEDWPLEGEFDNIHNRAFPISKYICDRLLSQAVDRGLPAKSFRFPSLGGDSEKGGNISLFGNRLLMRMISYMYLGVMPARNLPIIVLPVDVCAKLAVSVFLNDKAGHEIYNVSNPHVGDELELEDVAKELFGNDIETVETEEFFKKVEELDERKVQGAAGEIVALIKKGVKLQKAISEIEENLPEPIIAWVCGQKNVFSSKKLEDLVPEYPKSLKSSWDVVKADLQHVKESGFFKKIGLHSNVTQN